MKKSMLKTLLGSVREYKLTSILTPLFMIGEVVGECFIPYLMATKLLGHLNAVNNGATLDVAHLITWSVILVLCGCLSMISGSLAGIYASKSANGFGKNLRQDLYYAVQNYSFANIDKFSSSSLVTRLTTDVSNVQMAYMMIIRTAVRAPLMMIVSTIFAISIYPKVGFVYLGVIPFLIITLGLILVNAIKIFNRIFKKYDALNNSVQENVKGMRVVKSYVREDFEKQKFNRSAEDVQKAFTKAERLVALNNPVMSFAMYATNTIIFFIAARAGIYGGDLAVSDLSALVSYSVQVVMSFMMLSMIFVMITIAVASGKRIVEVLEEQSTITNPENPVMEVADGSVVFDNVSFKYSESAEKHALTDINLDIKSGETVGVLGATGSSKSTLVQLVSRLYDVSDGSIKVGGVDVKDYDIKSLRDSVSVVLQKNVLFSGTISENIRWGDKDASQEEVERVCKMAQAHEFITSFPDGYDTFIEQGGTNVSGGQKQRLCIARALLKKPKILILDDSTSAVDTKTDAMIRMAVAKQIPDTTKIIIAQRVSSVMDADKIIIMNNGTVDAVGTHEELLANNEIYQEVYHSQNNIGCDADFDDKSDKGVND